MRSRTKTIKEAKRNLKTEPCTLPSLLLLSQWSPVKPFMHWQISFRQSPLFLHLHSLLPAKTWMSAQADLLLDLDSTVSWMVQ